MAANVLTFALSTTRFTQSTLFDSNQSFSAHVIMNTHTVVIVSIDNALPTIYMIIVIVILKILYNLAHNTHTLQWPLSLTIFLHPHILFMNIIHKSRY